MIDLSRLPSWLPVGHAVWVVERLCFKRSRTGNWDFPEKS